MITSINMLLRNLTLHTHGSLEVGAKESPLFTLVHPAGSHFEWLPAPSRQVVTVTSIPVRHSNVITKLFYSLCCSTGEITQVLKQNYVYITMYI